ncbi:MAG: hypothetical protein ACOY5V_06935 [Pseudomonadota bacterium]
MFDRLGHPRAQLRIVRALQPLREEVDAGRRGRVGSHDVQVMMAPGKRLAQLQAADGGQLGLALGSHLGDLLLVRERARHDERCDERRDQARRPTTRERLAQPAGHAPVLAGCWPSFVAARASRGCACAACRRRARSERPMRWGTEWGRSRGDTGEFCWLSQACCQGRAGTRLFRAGSRQG